MMCTCNSSQFHGNHHCTICCVDFTSQSAFAEHLVVHRGVVRHHLDPAEAGLERKRSGAWGAPAGANPWG